jgi:hypothetical protein
MERDMICGTEGWYGMYGTVWYAGDQDGGAADTPKETPGHSIRPDWQNMSWSPGWCDSFIGNIYYSSASEVMWLLLSLAICFGSVEFNPARPPTTNINIHNQPPQHPVPLSHL